MSAYQLDEGVRIAAALEQKAAKRRIDLFPPEGMLGPLEAIEFGAKKYAARAWEKGLDFKPLFAAAQRHQWDWWAGTDNDVESGINHLKHAACDLIFLITFLERGIGNDDRPTATRIDDEGYALARKAKMDELIEHNPDMSEAELVKVFTNYYEQPLKEQHGIPR